MVVMKVGNISPIARFEPTLLAIPWVSVLTITLLGLTVSMTLSTATSLSGCSTERSGQPITIQLVCDRGFTSWKHLRSYQDGYRLITMCTL